jgi:hypothetical protein
VVIKKFVNEQIMNSPYVALINHASILISNGKKTLLTDTWFSKSVFDDSWTLLFENKEKDIKNIFNNLNYIWISHEHPDHFSTNFFEQFGSIIKSKNITIIFQKTFDRRVVGFLNKRGFKTIELTDGEEFKIDNSFLVTVQKYDFYDSSLIAKVNNFKIFNLNDCSMNSEQDIIKFKKKYGVCDFLFSQFSYAAWKGGKSNIEWRKKAAELKIQAIIKQSKILEAKYTIPFASFIFFSDKYNYYLNDSVNKPYNVIEKTNGHKTKFLFLKPYKKLMLKSPKLTKEGETFWEVKFNNIKLKEKENIAYSYNELKFFFESYLVRVSKKNSFIFIQILYGIKFLKIFQPVIIKIKDLDITCIINLAKKTFCKSDMEADIEMNSRSLKLILCRDHGFDTLTISGCFEEIKKNGFIKMTKLFALENLNNLGIYLNFKIFFKLGTIVLFLKKLANVQKELTFKYIQKME